MTVRELFIMWANWKHQYRVRIYYNANTSHTQVYDCYLNIPHDICDKKVKGFWSYKTEVTIEIQA